MQMQLQLLQLLFYEEQRRNLREAFWVLGDKRKQQEYVNRYVLKTDVRRRRSKNPARSRTSKKCSSPLATDQVVPVCAVFFMSTLNLKEYTVRRYVDRKTTEGNVIEDRRRGFPKAFEERYTAYRKLVKEHIDKYTRREAHYVRSNTEYQYFSPDLFIGNMYRSFETENPTCNVSEEYYRQRFREMKLKFHRSKKDLCSVCLNACEKGETETEEFKQHIAEKEVVNDLMQKAVMKSRDSNDCAAVVLDLQEVMYVPVSNRDEVFYKSRLACYNFTTYEMSSCEGTCFFA